MLQGVSVPSQIPSRTAARDVSEASCIMEVEDRK
jgi:hypothetical protein